MENTKFLRLLTNQYKGGHRMTFIYTTLNRLEDLFGEAHYHYEDDFPDDTNKVSVCFGLINQFTNKVVYIWSFKIWHYNDVEIDKTEFVEFSAYYENKSDLDLIEKLLQHKEPTEQDLWITTDPDNLQFKTRKGYIFKEFNRKTYPEIFKTYASKSDKDLIPIWNENKYWIVETIDLSEYSLSDILTIVLNYENGLDDFILKYKNNSEDILAEFIFENENGLY